jgi:hypothetical protein
LLESNFIQEKIKQITIHLLKFRSYTEILHHKEIPIPNVFNCDFHPTLQEEIILISHDILKKIEQD